MTSTPLRRAQEGQEMTVEEPTGGTPVNNAPVIDAERAAWFAQFGYTGAHDEVVTLRNGLGTAKAQDVWAILQGLRALQEDFSAQFDRNLNSAHAELRPIDPAKRLSMDEYGATTDYTTGKWLPGRREIVVALTESDAGEGSFADEPLVAAETSETA